MNAKSKVRVWALFVENEKACVDAREKEHKPERNKFVQMFMKFAVRGLSTIRRLTNPNESF